MSDISRQAALAVLTVLLAVAVLAAGNTVRPAVAAPAAPSVTRTYPGPAPCNTTLQACVTGSADGDIINIASGTYTIPELVISKSLTLNGAGAGATVLLPDGAHRVVQVSGGIAKGVTLTRLAIRKGSGVANGAGISSGAGTPLALSQVEVTGNASTSSGGGIFVEGPLIASSLTLSGNSAPNGAGGGLRASGTVDMTDSTIEGNTSFNPGGGMRVDGKLSISNSTVRSNKNTAAGTNGGGIRADGGLTMVNCTVEDNVSANNGGGVYATTATVAGGAFRRNAAVQGGGIYTTGALAINGGALLQANTASADGAGAWAGGALAVDGGQVRDNVAAGSGGGLYAALTASLTNVAVSGNQANLHGGGLYAVGAATLSGGSFASNRANLGGGTANGGGAYLAAGGAASSQFSGNSARDGGGLYATGGATDLTGAVFTGNSAARNGGGARIAGGTLDRCRFEGNASASEGAGAAVFAATNVNRCTFRGNTGSLSGALAADFSQGELLAVTNSLFFDNGASTGSGGNDMRIFDVILGLANNTFGRSGAAGRPSVLVYRATVTAANNIWSGYTLSLQRGDTDSSGSENFNILHNAPLGPGFTPGAATLAVDPQFANPGTGDFTLGAGSPAIDSGSNAALPAGFTSDLSGLPRRVDVLAVADTGAGSAPIIDRGAFERPNNISTATPTATSTLTPTVTRTPTATSTATRTATATANATATPTATATATQAGVATPTATPTATATLPSGAAYWLYLPLVHYSDEAPGAPAAGSAGR